ncbi:helix-turn-helix domain-containing protein [Nocardia mexicana]|uniref:Helix-turn-helix protein n=1 Tax=Nocardia mexicana TaxID=279262 RepID=A0A370H1S9_9NOCA|nr:helix-turn-helix transcriptional regulator [Nocardia mexicana]RDI49966.1 helix-turn-helix protein [Nocardia mexicana]
MTDVTEATEDDETEDTRSTLPRRQLGRLLREAREAMGMTTETAARAMGCSKNAVSQLELGRVQRIRERDIRDYCDLYGIEDEKRDFAMELARQKPVRSWLHGYDDIISSKFNLYTQLESAASALAIFQSLMIPGLLQTSDYATAVGRQFYTNEADVERSVNLRLKRQHLLIRTRKPLQINVIITESVLRTMVGSPSVMSAQLRHAVALAARDNVTIRLLPHRAGLPLGYGAAPFIVLTFPKDGRGRPIEPSTVFAENVATGDVYLERREDVRRCREAFDKLFRASLDAGPTRDLMREAANNYDRFR